MTAKQIIRFNNERQKVLSYAQELIKQETNKEKINQIYKLAMFIQKNTSFKYFETTNQESQQ